MKPFDVAFAMIFADRMLFDNLLTWMCRCNDKQDAESDSRGETIGKTVLNLGSRIKGLRYSLPALSGKFRM